MRDIYTKVYDVRNTVFSDQTGQFPTRSKLGNKYIMVMVEIDSNAILVEPIKNRTDAEFTRAYQAMMLRLKQAGIIPQKHILDNEVSNATKTVIRDEYNMKLELVPPSCHRRNAAEVAIHNSKAHFLSILAGTATSFPPNLWDRILPQAEVTINLLQQYNATPKVSTYAHLSGPFDYNNMTLLPMRCEAQVHDKTNKRGTWAYHSVDGWYLATSPEHYRTHLCHIKTTNSERFTDTVQFSHHKITKPAITHADKIMSPISDCNKAIKKGLQWRSRWIKKIDETHRKNNKEQWTDPSISEGAYSTHTKQQQTVYKKYGQGHPTIYEGAPHSSSEGGQDDEDITTRLSTQQLDISETQGA